MLHWGGESIADEAPGKKVVEEDKEKDKDKADDKDHESDDEGEEQKGPPNVAQWFADSKSGFKTSRSFHTLHVREDHQQILLCIRHDRLDTPFFNQLTYVGAEGALPDMIDCTPSMVGFRFRWAPNGKDVHLVHLQQKLSSTDLAASLYDATTGGALPGYLRSFKPLAVDEVAKVGAQPKADAPAGGAADNTAPVAQAASAQARGGPALRSPCSDAPFRPLISERGERSSSTTASDTDAPKKDKSNKIPGREQDGKGKAGKNKKKTKKKMPPPAPGDECVLIDITSWLSAFALSANSQRATVVAGGRRRGSSGDSEANFVEARAFPENFSLRYMVQARGDSAVKWAGDERTAYYSVAFCRLPEEPMVPRCKDRRVGFFETPMLVGGERRANEETSVVNRWNLARRGGRLDYHIDPEVPKLFHATIKKGVQSWNAAFAAAGCGDNVVRCLAPGDEDFPADYSRGDARYSAIYLTDSMLPVYGFGPSLTDFRSGEILVAHVLLGFSVFVQEASRLSDEALEGSFVQQAGGCRPPLLDADHGNVLSNLLFTVMHEVGHTLGLRHNFLAQEDGNSSVMMYPDTVDTLSDPTSARFGGHFPTEPGKYDVYAIKYGYTPLHDEVRGCRHRALDMLANGQDLHEEMLSGVPSNPLFATDEDIGNDDPRVNRWNNSVEACGYDKLEHALRERHELLQLIRSGHIYPETFADRVRNSYSVVQRHVLDAVKLIGGSELGRTRTRFRRLRTAKGDEALRAVVDFCVGPLARLNEEEGHHMMRSFPRQGYQVSRVYLLSSHKLHIRNLLRSVLSARRLEQLEMQKALLKEGEDNDDASRKPEDSVPPLGTYELLVALAFRPGRRSFGLFHPFTTPSWPPHPEDAAPPSTRALAHVAQDLLYVEAALALARRANELANDREALAAVQVGAKAFVQQALDALSVVNGRALDPVSKAHWKAVADELARPPDKAQSQMGGLPFLLFREETEATEIGEEADGAHHEPPPGIECGHGAPRRRQGPDFGRPLPLRCGPFGCRGCPPAPPPPRLCAKL